MTDVSLSEDPQFTRTMTIMWWLEPTFNGTLLAVAADDVPSDALCGATSLRVVGAQGRTVFLLPIHQQNQMVKQP